MKKNYKAPVVQVVSLKMNQTLLTVSENTDSAATMSSGSFGARESGGFWDDDDD